MKTRFSFSSYIIYGELFKSLLSQFLRLLPNGCFTLLSVFLTYRIVDGMSSEPFGGFLFWPGLFLVTLKLAGNKALFIPRTLCSVR